MQRGRLVAVFLAALAATTSARLASACSACGCGDPTLTAMGAEKPYRNRLRVSLDGRYRSDDIGEPGVDQIRLREARLDGQVAWAPTEHLLLLASVPFLDRTIGYVNGGQAHSLALGDVELRAKVFLYQDRSFSPRHLYALIGGLKMPTAPRERDDSDGSYLPIEAQPGTGSWDPILGLSYAFFAQPLSFYASASGSAPLRGTSELRASASIRTTTTLQYQVVPWLAPRIGIDTRLDARSFEDGAPERDSSGFVAFLSPELILSPATDLVLVASLHLPVVQALAGYHHEGPVIGLAVAYDF